MMPLVGRPETWTERTQWCNSEHVCVFRCKQKVKLSLCFNWAPRHKGVLGERMYSSTHSLTSALDGGEWSASRLVRFIPRERAPHTHWVDPRAVLDAVVTLKVLLKLTQWVKFKLVSCLWMYRE
jgi:hypothetical protein